MQHRPVSVGSFGPPSTQTVAGAGTRPVTEEMVRDGTDRGRALLLAQRGNVVYKRLLENMRVARENNLAWDFTLVEADAGVGELMYMAVAAQDEMTPAAAAVAVAAAASPQAAAAARR